MDDPLANDEFDTQTFLRTLTSRPGVYQMRDVKERILYVGKAANLKKRVSSYFRTSGLPPKSRALMSQVTSVVVTVTHTEAEALLLESNLIKSEKPRYNILLRDDKSYPFIYLSVEDEFPQLTLHRGAKRKKGKYFGPYPNAGAVRESLQLLQKMFRVRQCEDSFFSNRQRPCLQYQIKRCTAPCVGHVSVENYAEDVAHTILFLEGKSTVLNDQLVARMDSAANSQDYEQAAVYRDQISSLQRVQQRQYISGEEGDLDILAVASEGRIACVQVFFIRGGRHLGNRVFFPVVPANSSDEEVLYAFITQYYLSREIPRQILTQPDLGEAALLSEVLGDRAGHKVVIRSRCKGDRVRWQTMCLQNAKQALTVRLSSQAGMQQRLIALQSVLELDEIPTRMECFDISHTSGEKTVASCVVFDNSGPCKQDYRSFSIKGITPGDDYAAMEQALTRRYTRLQKESAVLPDILFIDGGKGQVSTACRVLRELQIEGVMIVGVAKGRERKAGMEMLHIPAQDRIIGLESDSPALHLIQQIRDEAHRFAIAGHRSQRARARQHSPLEQVPGIGARRRQLLLKHFGGLKEISRAGVEDLMRIKGISRGRAQLIYDAFHEES
jgi:excinuclease ABC subunit C